jgi:hypothetical protein
MRVRIFGLDSNGKPFSSVAETLDVSPTGARLAGVHQFEIPGETIGLEIKGKKGRFLVVWVGKRGTRVEGQIGIRSIESVAIVWELTTSPEMVPSVVQSPATAPTNAKAGTARSQAPSSLAPRAYERRTAKRLALKAGAKVTPLAPKLDGRNTGWGICTDLSRSGCYIETVYPLPEGTRIEVALRLEAKEVHATAVVRGSKPNWGMGVQFLKMSDADRDFLIDLIEGPAAQSHRQGSGH